MYALAVELTAACNQKCSYCYNAWREDDGKAMGLPPGEALRARLERLFDTFAFDHVTLTGGEPFSRSDVWAVLDLLAARGLGVQIISNGGLVTDKVADALAAHRERLRFVQVTLNGPDAALHEAHVGEGHFERTLAGIRRLRARDLPVVGCVVVTKKNHARVGETLALFRQLGVESIALSRFSPAGYAARHAAELLPSVDDATRALEQALPWARGDHDGRAMSVQVTMPMPPCAIEVERFAPIRFGGCPIGTEMQELALGPDGRLRHCTLHEHGLGDGRDVLDGTLDAVAAWRAEGRAYRAALPAFCRGCSHASTCGGGCGAAAHWMYGDARAHPDPLVAQHLDDAYDPARAAKRRLSVVA